MSSSRPAMSFELVGQAFQLVAGLDRDALFEIAAADLCRALPQRLDRNDHPACQDRPARKASARPPASSQAERLIDS